VEAGAPATIFRGGPRGPWGTVAGRCPRRRAGGAGPGRGRNQTLLASVEERKGNWQGHSLGAGQEGRERSRTRHQKKTHRRIAKRPAWRRGHGLAHGRAGRVFRTIPVWGIKKTFPGADCFRGLRSLPPRAGPVCRTVACFGPRWVGARAFFAAGGAPPGWGGPRGASPGFCTGGGYIKRKRAKAQRGGLGKRRAPKGGGGGGSFTRSRDENKETEGGKKGSDGLTSN